MKGSKREWDHDKSSSARAPASTANLGPGYDIFGLGLDALYDTVTITRVIGSTDNAIEIRNENRSSQNIPQIVEKNSAGLVVKKMAQDNGIRDNLILKINKGIPAGYGMGSSAASAAAAAVAFDNLYNLELGRTDLVRYAAQGEIASAGVAHYDNVAGSLLGGFVIVRTFPQLEFIRFDAPEELIFVLAVPSIPVPEKKTQMARSVLPEKVLLKNVVHNVTGASTIVSGFAFGDVKMIAKGIDDAIVEPARKHLIPNFDIVKKNAIDSGALAATISGAGPSIISILETSKNARNVAEAMAEAFKKGDINSQTFICRSSTGTTLISNKQ